MKRRGKALVRMRVSVGKIKKGKVEEEEEEKEMGITH